MLAIYRRELRSFFHGMMGYVLTAFLLAASGIYFLALINPASKVLLLSSMHPPLSRKVVWSISLKATLAAFGAAEAIKGDKVALQYTTTSARLHQLLGVAPA